MAKRILPYRDYSEHDVVNLFALDVSGLTLTSLVPNNSTAQAYDSGVVVKVKTGVLPGDAPSQLDSASGDKLRDYLGASFSSAHIGYNAYPSNGMTVEPADGGEVALGITLRETLAFGENGEKMLYNKQQLDEAQAVLPGETVPVLTRGLVLLSEKSFVSSEEPAVGQPIYPGAGGLLTDTATGSEAAVGVCVATGQDSGAGATTKYLCKISF
jgi:hypothetical protein